jgi:hypothetical protein
VRTQLSGGGGEHPPRPGQVQPGHQPFGIGRVGGQPAAEQIRPQRGEARRRQRVAQVLDVRLRSEIIVHYQHAWTRQGWLAQIARSS